MARRVVDLRSRLEDAARRFPKGPVRPREESRTDGESDVAAPSESTAAPDVDAGTEPAVRPEVEAPHEIAETPETDVPAEHGATPEAEVTVERGATAEVDGTVERGATAEADGTVERGATAEVDGTVERGATAEADATVERGATAEVDGTVERGVTPDVGEPAGVDHPPAVPSRVPDASAVPKPPKPPMKRPRKRVVRKRGRAAVTKAAAAAAGTLPGKKSKASKKRTPRRRATQHATPRDPFSARLRSLEREIEDALQEVGGDGPGVGSALQQAGEQLLGFYADLARAAVEGGIEAAFARMRMIGTADTVDEFGFDAAFHERALPLLRFLHDRWWRVESTGIRHVPRTGRVMLVGNHSGGSMPYDGLMIAHALEARRAGRGRAARPLVEDGAYHFPFAGSPLARLGVVRASAANAERLLGSDEAIVVFPEGAKGSRKYYRDRYRLQRFARGGFVSLALRTDTPLVPVAVVGAEEIYPVLLRWQWLARVLGVPEFPVTPTFPLLGLLGLIPLPTKWRIVFGAPIDLVAEHGAEAHDDELLVNRVKESVRERVQRMLIDALRERDSVFTG